MWLACDMYIALLSAYCRWRTRRFRWPGWRPWAVEECSRGRQRCIPHQPQPMLSQWRGGVYVIMAHSLLVVWLTLSLFPLQSHQTRAWGSLDRYPFHPTPCRHATYSPSTPSEHLHPLRPTLNTLSATHTNPDYPHPIPLPFSLSCSSFTRKELTSITHSLDIFSAIQIGSGSNDAANSISLHFLW